MADRKQELINKIIQAPLEFNGDELNELVSKDLELNFSDLRQFLMRIFDINEATLKLQSDVTKGVLGFLNKISTHFRHKHYYKRIKNGFRNPGKSNNKVIVAEGDSWFQFPFFIKDIIDWLCDKPDFAVYCIAYGGDWFTNILYEEKYIEELSIHLPDVFMISGGGNDLVGSNRLAIMVNPDCGCERRDVKQLNMMLAEENEIDRADIEIGYNYINPAFYSFIWVLKAQYYILFRNLHAAKFAKMQIITQGYDYAIPTYEYRWKKWYALQPVLNYLIGSGKWLKQPLMLKGIVEADISKKIIKALIFEINFMFSELAANKNFPNVYHIDCRGVAENFSDWFDELHLHSEKFQEIANVYKNIIETRPDEKVIKVKNRKYSR